MYHNRYEEHAEENVEQSHCSYALSRQSSINFLCDFYSTHIPSYWRNQPPNRIRRSDSRNTIRSRLFWSSSSVAIFSVISTEERSVNQKARTHYSIEHQPLNQLMISFAPLIYVAGNVLFVFQTNTLCTPL